MTRNLKKAALNSLDGKWELGIGVSALNYFGFWCKNHLIET
ncbi:hypothetical protein QRY57_10550 [Bacillus arachidis]|nr:hypothetical protein [Bacillus arachidis]WIY63728.1 hypothetical protein QRY57_10550 [Bacillus arachidis]